jgi:hypothetical protein
VSRCGRCNRPLTDAGSIELGFGPGCWDQLSATARAAAIATEVGTSVPALERRPADGARLGSAALTGPPAADPVGHVRRSRSSFAVALAWVVVLLAAFVVVEHWRWILLGAVVLGVVAGIGLSIEGVQHRRAVRRRAAATTPARAPAPSAPARTGPPERRRSHR